MTCTEIIVAGTAVHAPMTVLVDYMARYGGTLDTYDFAFRGEPDVLTAEEIWRTRIIHSRVTHAETSELERAATGWNSLWEAVPSDAHIKNADPVLDGGLYDDMLELYTHMTDIHGASAAKASKVLHFKRPHLYPILDSRLIAIYRACSWRLSRPRIQEDVLGGHSE